MSHVMFGGLTHEPAVRLAARLVEITPEPLRHVFLADSGSVSVEVAVKMCKHYWRSVGKPEKQRLLTCGYTVNSPGLIRSLDLAGRTVVQKTTAGTVGALAVASAPLVLCASFVVAGATARFLKTDGSGPVTFVVTGDDGQAAEDLACAEYIGQHLAKGDAEVAPYLHRARTSRAAADLADGVRRGYQGVHPDDVDLCLEVVRFPFAMVARQEDSLTVLRPVAAPDE